ncbi:MAG TPA: discoidin domain-containing protein, partial [Mycobacterium sp.]|nr:discoidin domain-containing protein [Mycobacterium sp.]
QTPEEPVNLSRTLTVPAPTAVSATVWVRGRQGPRLADLIAEPGITRAHGDSDLIDVDGSAYAATDGDPRTSWTAPQNVVQHKSPPTLTVTLPEATEVTGLRLTPSSSALPTHPTMVAIDLGDGPQVRRLKSGDDAGAQTVPLRPRVTDTVYISLLDWDDVIDRTALGFDQIKPPGLAEVAVRGPGGSPVAQADAARNGRRVIEIPCGQGPIVAVSGRFVQTSVTTTVAALLGGEPIPAKACDPAPIQLPAGQQELLVSPGSAFIVDGVALTGPLANQIPTATTTPAEVTRWGPDRREIALTRAPVARVLVVPESVNPGWVAHTPDGVTLKPVIVNGWQQGWVVPAGEQGTITLTFPSNATYRTGLTVGLALLALLLLLALVPPRRQSPPHDPARPWTAPLLAAAAVLTTGTLVAGIGGLLVFGAALAVTYALRTRRRLRDRLTLWAASCGLILAGTVLSRYPWRSIDGYVGHSPWVQLLALVSLAALAASVVPRCRPSPESGPENA